MDVESGATHRLRDGLVEAGMPEWSPDGQQLVVFGRSRDVPPWLADWDWWVVKASGGKSTATGAFRLLKTEGFETLGLKAPRVAAWKKGELLFTALRGDSVNVWAIAIKEDARAVSVVGPAQRMTSGNGFDLRPIPVSAGRMVFAALSVASDVWNIPLDANSAAVRGPRQRLTQSVGPHFNASLTADGSMLAFSVLRYGRQRAMIRNLATGVETPYKQRRFERDKRTTLQRRFA